MKIATEDVILIKRYDKHRCKSNISIVEEFYEGKINIIRALELSYDTWKRQKAVHQCSKQPLNVNASEFKPRRNAASIAEIRIRDAAEGSKD